MKKFFNKVLSVLCFILGIRGTDIHRQMVDNGLSDYSGQGRNKYGR